LGDSKGKLVGQKLFDLYGIGILMWIIEKVKIVLLFSFSLYVMDLKMVFIYTEDSRSIKAIAKLILA
jgi:hypothetical protein